jgi:hypothetical protein
VGTLPLRPIVYALEQTTQLEISMYRFRVPLLVGSFGLMGCAAAGGPSVVPDRPTASAASVRVDELRARVYAFAHDSMMGRASGTVYTTRAEDYIAREAARLGLEPAGENGTFFQYVLEAFTLDSVASHITVPGRAPFRAWRDFLPRHQGGPAVSVSAPVVFGGVWGSNDMVSPESTAGAVVVIVVPPLASGQPGWQANRGALSQRYQNAAAVVVGSLDAIPGNIRPQLSVPNMALRQPGDGPAGAVPAFLYSSAAMTEALLGKAPSAARVGDRGPTVNLALTYRREPAAGRNVVAVLRGSDPVLRNEYVAIGSHHDHVGFTSTPVDHDSLRAFNLVVRPKGADDFGRQATAEHWPLIRAKLDSMRALRPPRADSINNGADDNASGSMAMLEIARTMASAPVRPRRSILFVWHAAEEIGLYGSEYFTEHPTVPRDRIVAQLNADMIGRGMETDIPGGGMGYVQLIGSRRLSTELGNLVEEVGRRQPVPFTFDYQYDADGHPQQYYCRSDHYNYARWGIPVSFFSTGGHVDYHMPTDEPQYINYDKLRAVAQLIHDVATEVANRPTRPVVDKPVPDPYGQCRQ